MGTGASQPASHSAAWIQSVIFLSFSHFVCLIEWLAASRQMNKSNTTTEPTEQLF
jgi:hypothetical protein